MGKSLRAIREYLKNDFALYLRWSLDFDGLKAEPNQIEIANHLQYGGNAVGAMAARGSSKTLIGSTHYVNWRHLRCPNTKVLILSGVESHAQNIARANHDNYSTLPWLKHLAPKRGSSETAFNLSGVVIEPTRSLTSYSVLGNFTGLRSDLVIQDDIQMEGQTSDERYGQILDKASKAVSLLRDPEKRPTGWYADCPWSGDLPANAPERTQQVVLGNHQDPYNDVYTPPDDAEAPHFMRRVNLRKWPAIVPDDSGVEVPGYPGRWVSSFPNILTVPYLLEKKASGLSSMDWACQYMLDKTLCPRPEDCILDLKKITALSWDETDEKAKGIKNWYAVIDPADGGGDYFVTTICSPFLGTLYIRDIWSWQRQDSEQCLYLAMKRAADAGDVRKLYFESSFTALGSVIKLVKERDGFKIPHEPIQSRENKLRRTVNTLEPGLHSGKMRLHRKLVANNPEVRRQLENLRAGSMPKPHDDVVDCLGFCYRVFEDKLGFSGKKGQVSQVLVA